jgi:signal transduction histidine kinase
LWKAATGICISDGSSHDSLDNLVAYLREYAARYFEGTSIRCRLSFPENVAALPVSAELRRGLFLVVKEALHNVVKHSGATTAEIELRLKHSTLNVPVSTLNEKAGMESGADTEMNTIAIGIADNGRGFDQEAVSRFSNGLQNMRRRLAESKGTIEIEPHCAEGTCVQLLVTL